MFGRAPSFFHRIPCPNRVLFKEFSIFATCCQALFWIAGRSDVAIKSCQSTGTIVHAVGVRSDVLFVRGHSRFLRSLSTGEVNALHFCDIRLDDGRTLVSSHFIPRFVCIPSGFLRVWISVALHCHPGLPKVCCVVVDIPVDSCEVLLCHQRALLGVLNQYLIRGFCCQYCTQTRRTSTVDSLFDREPD